MATKFIKAVFDIDCEWEGYPPQYRMLVNGELFAERTWIWTQQYLTEMVQIRAEPGVYQVSIDPIGPNLAKFTVSNRRVEIGPAKWLDGPVQPGHLEVLDEG